MSFTSSKGSQGSECSALQQEKLAREQWDSPVSRELRERGRGGGGAAASELILFAVFNKTV